MPFKVTLKKIRPYRWLLIAVLVHIVLAIYFRYIIVVAPMVHKVLFKSQVIDRPKEPAKRVQRRVKKISSVMTKIPAKIIPQQPKIKQRIKVKDIARAPRIRTKLPEIKPKELELAKKKRINTARIKTDARMHRQKAVRQFAKKFDISGKGKRLEAEFTPVLATCAGGDWNINPTAIPNLMLEITRRSNIKAALNPVTVRMDSSDISKSPFVYFTGTKDFQLTEKEVGYLRKYILQGGSVFADNSLPGKRSSFDIAFRREMARVLPQYPFKPIPSDHPVFDTVYHIKETPVGMNWRCDPIEVIMIHGRTAVIYTLNDYGDLWETKFRKDGKVDTSLDENWSHVWGPHWEHGGRNFRYENVNEESIEAAYRLGVNIIAYFLTELK